MSKIKRFACVYIVFLAAVSPATVNAEGAEPRSGLSTPIVIVHDIESSLAFYREILGFEPTEIYSVDKLASTKTLGLDRFGGFQVSYLQPVGTFKSGVDTFALAEPTWTDKDKVEVAQDCESRKTSVGSVVLSFQVYGLDEILDRAAANDVCIVSPIALSSSGKSRTAGIMDPNGINMELYEYVPEET